MMRLWVTGHVRSGTSMVAGLFREHGVFFGKTTQGDQHNRKGYLENMWLKQQFKAGKVVTLSKWENELLAEGWNGEPWGVKVMPVHWPVIRYWSPSVIVLCQRPAADILESCRRVPWGGNRSLETIEQRRRAMLAIAAEAECPVFSCYTPDIVDGDYRALLPAFGVLGLTFDPVTALKWVDPELWHG